jgi:hypothetical protein
MIDRIAPVETVGATGELQASAYRNDHMPLGRTGSIAVLYAVNRGWPTSIPPWAILGTTLIIGALAGFYPAITASRLSPTEALTAP